MVTEIDMPQRAYLDIPRGFAARSVRITPFSLAVVGHSREQVSAAGYAGLNEIFKEMDAKDGIIWWRLRPEVTENIAVPGEPKPDHQWKWRCRLATSPELPPSFFETFPWFKPEGAVASQPEQIYAAQEDPLVGSDLYTEDADFDEEVGKVLEASGIKDIYSPSLMRRLRSQTDLDNFGCAAMHTPRQEAAGHTLIAATIDGCPADPSNKQDSWQPAPTVPATPAVRRRKSAASSTKPTKAPASSGKRGAKRPRHS